MNIKKLFSNKKFKNTFFTVIEILIVAGIIYGAMMFVLEKVNKDADKTGITTQKKEDTGTGNYSIDVNLAKNVVIIYEKQKDKTQKAIKVFDASIGKDLSKGKHSIKEKYSWVREEEDWQQFAVKISNGCYIGSASYKNKYPYTLDRKSYNNIGKKVSGDNIYLFARDAQWIYDNCKSKTKVTIIKGKKTDEIPLETATKVKLSKQCDWDPTDVNKNNPFNKIEKGKIVIGANTIHIEKGSDIDYLANVLLINSEGEDISKTIEYKKIDSEELGKQEITYQYVDASGKKQKVVQKVYVEDTTAPIVSCSKKQFTYQVDGRSKEDMNSEDNVKAIEKMVRGYVSVNESDCTITVRTVGETELMEDNFPVSIKAKDPSGNVGSCQVLCEITVKKTKGSNKNTPDKKIEQLIKYRLDKEDTTKKKEKETKKKEKETKADDKAAEENEAEKSEE